MKNILPRLPLAWFLVALAVADGQTTEQPPGFAEPNSADAGAVKGQQLIERAQVTLARHASIAAKMRQRVDLFGHELVGSGEYLQARDAEATKHRMVLKIQAAGQVSSTLQVNDGNYLWTERQMGDEHTVDRVDLRRLKKAWGKAVDPAGELPTAALATGGIGGLLSGLAGNFDFGEVDETLLSELPVYVLSGHWKPQRLAEMLPDQQKTIEAGGAADLEALPAHVPHEVVLVLSQDDLFPYVLDFRRRTWQQTEQGRMATARSILQIQLFEVRINGPTDARQFVYKPPNLQVTDVTGEYLKRLRSRGYRQLE